MDERNAPGRLYDLKITLLSTLDRTEKTKQIVHGNCWRWQIGRQVQILVVALECDPVNPLEKHTPLILVEGVPIHKMSYLTRTYVIIVALHFRFV